MNNADVFIGRLPKGAPKHLADDIRLAFATLPTARELIGKVRGNTKLSKIGKSLEIAKALTDGPLAHVSQLRQNASKRRADATGQRAKFRDDVTKASTFSDALKAETRAWFRGQPLERKHEFIGLKDPLILEAILTAPPFLSDLPPDIWELVVMKAIEDRHGDALAQIEKLEEAYDVGDSAFETVERLIGNEADVSPELVRLSKDPDKPLEKPMDENGDVIRETKTRAEFNGMGAFERAEFFKGGGALVD